MHLNLSKSTRYIVVGSNRVGSEGASALAAALSQNRTLIELKLRILAGLISPIGNNAIKGDGAASLAKALIQNKTLKSIFIGNTSFLFP